MTRSTGLGRTAALALVVLVTGCGSASVSGPVSVKAADTICVVGAHAVKAGRDTFAVTNEGSDITEVYVYATGDRVMGEVENIAPGGHGSLVVDLPPGSYQVACKPGMVGDGIRSALRVTGTPVPPAPLSSQLATAVSDYRGYVATEAAALVTTTVPFVAAIKAGDLARAKLLYPEPRVHYERIEPIAESFGDLDPLIDERINDVTAGATFVGFHRLEQDLWRNADISKDGPVADQLLASTQKLAALIRTVAITPLTMASGAKSLLDEVATSKVTGEEERYSHLDLVDFAANVDGSKYAYTELRPVIAATSPGLVATLDARFVTLDNLLAQHAASASADQASGNPYVLYTALSKPQIKALAVDVDALSAPLGQIAGALPKA